MRKWTDLSYCVVHSWFGNGRYAVYEIWGSIELEHFNSSTIVLGFLCLVRSVASCSLQKRYKCEENDTAGSVTSFRWLKHCRKSVMEHMFR